MTAEGEVNAGALDVGWREGLNHTELGLKLEMPVVDDHLFLRAAFQAMSFALRRAQYCSGVSFT